MDTTVIYFIEYKFLKLHAIMSTVVKNRVFREKLGFFKHNDDLDNLRFIFLTQS